MVVIEVRENGHENRLERYIVPGTLGFGAVDRLDQIPVDSFRWEISIAAIDKAPHLVKDIDSREGTLRSFAHRRDRCQ